MILEKWDETRIRQIRRLLRVKKRQHRKFRRHMAWRWVKLDYSWRYPDGRDNKLRLQYKGYPPKVKVGFRSPKLVRFLHPSGKREILVYRVEDLFTVDPLTDVVRIASNVGLRKRLEIVRFAQKFGIRVLNPGKIPEVRLETPPQLLEEGLETLVEEIETEEALEKELEGISERSEEAEKESPAEENKK